MEESSASAPVPAFLMKLWALLEDPGNSDVITWSWDGQNFCILDDQRFSKEILPKYFKHNNLSSFIRQLNMYGFRKVMSLEGGLVRSDRGSVIEFHHPFFKKGKTELLEQIKRKITSSTKSEDPPLSQEELQKVIAELQDLKDVQSNMDVKLENMRKENKALWKEVSSLRRKHSQQQKLLTKIFQFILGLMRGNIVMGPNRKRQLTLEATSSPSSPPPKYSRNVLQFAEGGEGEPAGNPADNTLQILEVFCPGEGTSDTIAPTQNFTGWPATDSAEGVKDDSVQEIVIDDSVLQSLAEQSLIPSSSEGREEQTMGVVQANCPEDADSVISSILNESSAAGSNDLLYREDIQDFLSCIDASLEELQTLLSRKKLNVDTDIIDELFKPDLSSSDNPVRESNPSLANEVQADEEEVQADEEEAALRISDDPLSKDMQLMEYTGNPLLSLFDLHPGDYGTEAADPTSFLTAGGSASQSGIPGQNPDPLVEDDKLLPLFTLSPVNKLIDEAEEADAL